MDKNSKKIQINRAFPSPGNHNMVICKPLKELDLSTYKPIRSGIIPYIYDKTENHHHFYFAVNPFNGQLGDFGGGISSKENFVEGSIRECIEESCNLFSFNYEQVIEKSYVCFSEEMAFIFVPISPIYGPQNLRLMKFMFKERSSQILAKLEQVKLALENLETKKTCVDEEELKGMLTEMIALNSMLEKSDIELVRDDQLFSDGQLQFYEPILNLLKKISVHLDPSKKKLEQQHWIATNPIGFSDIVKRCWATLSKRKVDFISEQCKKYNLKITQK